MYMAIKLLMTEVQLKETGLFLKTNVAKNNVHRRSFLSFQLLTLKMNTRGGCHELTSRLEFADRLNMRTNNFSLNIETEQSLFKNCIFCCKLILTKRKCLYSYLLFCFVNRQRPEFSVLTNCP